MRHRSLAALVLAAALPAGCAKPVPRPANVAAGEPHVSWVVMFGDRDNPDREFSCQSEPRNDCVLPASRPDNLVFSDVHVYYHRAGGETKYAGAFTIGFFQGSGAGHDVKTDVTVQKDQAITNQSVTGIVTSTPGTSSVAFDLVATQTTTGKSQPIRASIPIVVQ
jgi:hypothetical protein